MGNTVADTFDPAGDFVAEHNGRKRAVTHQQIGVTEAAVRDPDKHLARPRRTHFDIID